MKSDRPESDKGSNPSTAINLGEMLNPVRASVYLLVKCRKRCLLVGVGVLSQIT